MKFLSFSWIKILWIILAWIGAVILHNAFYGVFGVEEAVFFILATIVIPLYFLVFVVYNLVKKLRK
ncbi:hypothetical protein CO037_02630 [Candidatus Pacearchaeota archaeon CG_4_9_14_0_2_um_filter_30_8]|nr:MAG: hypothetical protein CO037_02630 [Candidatus Pacearchaeota archaeon CG_4_9_14_0_2_um_filter_30_8]